MIWKNLDYGFYVWINKNIVVTNTIMADNKVSFFLNGFGPGPLSHRSRKSVITIRDSLVIGRSSNFDCTNDDFVPWHLAQVGKRSSRAPGGKKNILH